MRSLARLAVPLLMLLLAAGCRAPGPSLNSGQAAQEGYVDAGSGVRLFYRMVGAGRDTMVVLHGGPGFTMDYFAADLAPLAERHTLLFYDQRGTGRSSLVSDSIALGAQRFAEDLEALRQHFGIDRLTLLGHSWGAAVAALYAERYPERLGRLLLVGPIPARRQELVHAFRALDAGRDSVTRVRMQEWYQARLANPGDAAACRAYYVLWFTPFFGDPTAANRSKGDFCAGSAESRRNKMTSVDRFTAASLGEWDWLPSLRAVTVPALVIHGTSDPLPVPSARQWAAALPNARLLLLQGIGHFPYLEAPDRFFAAINEFLRGRWPAGAMSASHLPAQPLPYDSMARRIVGALQVSAGERVLLRVDPATMAPLAPAVRSLLEARGAVVDALPYGPASDFEARLARTDIYVWLPTRVATPPDQSRALERWLDNGTGRELHFHWVEGARDTDGSLAPHTPAYDRVYLDALDIDYRQLTARMDDAIRRLRAGEVRVTTPHGTDIRFRVGNRPFNKQDGDASKARAATGRIRIDRHIELPAGVLRVAPVEESVTGVIVLPSARFGAVTAQDVRLVFERGVVLRARARVGNEALQAFLASDPAASRFRELCLGFNPRLVVPPGESALPYYGYGSGVVRMSLGDNTELGGNVRGGVVRWLFFADATVRVGSDVVVRDGKLR